MNEYIVVLPIEKNTIWVKENEFLKSTMTRKLSKYYAK